MSKIRIIKLFSETANPTGNKEFFKDGLFKVLATTNSEPGLALNTHENFHPWELTKAHLEHLKMIWNYSRDRKKWLVCVDHLHPSQQFFNYVRTGLPVLN